LPSRFTSKPVTYHRFAIPDHDVPARPEQMRDILDVIDAALAADDCIYVHCRAGIGRTGTAMGCYLVRHGCAGNAAIDALNVLWKTCARASSWPSIPETQAQRLFIRHYSDALSSNVLPVVTSAQLHRYQGALLGLAIGEVLGMARKTSSSTRDTTQQDMPNNLAGMHWGSDTAMTLALADSLLACQQGTPADQMQRYLAWQKQGQYSSHGVAENVPPLVVKALGLWQWKRNPVAGSHDPAVLDPHPLTRCTAVALYFARRPALAIREAAESARTTIQSPMVLDACRIFAALLAAIVEELPLSKLVEFSDGNAFAELRALSLKPELSNLIDGGWRTAMTHPAGEDVVSILGSAIHALATTQNFQAAVFKSMHNAVQPQTVGAVCGALAGAWYGVQDLPIVWRETLPKADELLVLAERLLTETGAGQ
jgi:ADP-ribosylglycohydrolase